MREAAPAIAPRSTDFVRAEDAPVATALKFIRENARRALAAREVVAASALSRRALEKAFRQQLNRTIMQEIRQARTDEIALLLIETNLTVKEIGYALGFPETGHVARYFRSAKRLSPTAFRRSHRSAQDDAAPQGLKLGAGAFPISLVQPIMLADATDKRLQRAPCPMARTAFANTG